MAVDGTSDGVVGGSSGNGGVYAVNAFVALSALSLVDGPTEYLLGSQAQTDAQVMRRLSRTATAPNATTSTTATASTDANNGGNYPEQQQQQQQDLKEPPPPPLRDLEEEQELLPAAFEWPLGSIVLMDYRTVHRGGANQLTMTTTRPPQQQQQHQHQHQHQH